MSENSESEQNNEAPAQNEPPQQEKTNAQESSEQQQKQAKPKAPRVGTPIGSPTGPSAAASPPTAARPRVGAPIGTPAGQQQQAQRPTVGTPVGTQARPTVGTPIGAQQQPQQRASVGTPVTTQRPNVGTPVGTPRPSVGTPVSRPGAPSPAGPAPTGPLPPKLPPPKPTENKVEVSRRNFIKGLAVLGGLAFLASYVPLFPYLQGSVGAQTLKDQQLVVDPDASPLTPITPASVGNGVTFTYPYTGDSNIDSDTFVQCVLIKLPPGLSIPSSYEQYAAKDPSGNIYMAFSRVCVHLWCLWGTGIDNADTQVGGPVLGPCPCHGSTYVPGTGGSSVYSKFPPAQNQVPGQAVAGPASLQPFPNNQLPIIKIRLASDGSFHAFGRVGNIGYCQQC